MTGGHNQSVEIHALFLAKVRRERDPRSAPAVCTTGASASCPAPAETRTAALLAPTAGAAETIRNPCVPMTPAEVRKPLGVDDTLKGSIRSLITLRY